MTREEITNLVTELIQKGMKPFFDAIDNDLTTFKNFHNDMLTIMDRKQETHYKLQHETHQQHAKQIEGYLAGFNKILEKKL